MKVDEMHKIGMIATIAHGGRRPLVAFHIQPRVGSHHDTCTSQGFFFIAKSDKISNYGCRLIKSCQIFESTYILRLCTDLVRCEMQHPHVHVTVVWDHGIILCLEDRHIRVLTLVSHEPGFVVPTVTQKPFPEHQVVPET